MNGDDCGRVSWVGSGGRWMYVCRLGMRYV